MTFPAEWSFPNICLVVNFLAGVGIFYSWKIMIEPKFILFNRGERDITFQALGITLKLVLVVAGG